MNLKCPHCREIVTVPDHLGGQTANCPKCGGPFLAPLPAPVAASAEPNLDAPKTIPLREEPTTLVASTPSLEPPLPRMTAPAPEPTPAPAAASDPGEYHHRRALYLQPAVVKWLTPVCLVVIFVLLFFPWVGYYAGDKMLVRQSGWGLAFGSFTEFRAKWLQQELLLTDNMPSMFAPLTLVYALLIALGFLAAVVLVVVAFIPVPAVEPYLPYRSLALGGLSILAFVFLLIQLVIGFPLERQVNRAADQTLETALKAAEKAKNPNLAETAAQIERGYKAAALERSEWLRMVFFLNLLAVVVSLTEFWLERRLGQPMPRVVFEW
jgi:hypothetical protein